MFNSLHEMFAMTIEKKKKKKKKNASKTHTGQKCNLKEINEQKQIGNRM